MTAKPKIGIILSTTRPARFADKPAQWLKQLADARGDANFEIVDLRHYPVPFFQEDEAPMSVPPKHPAALYWSEKLAELDGFIFVTAEYNRSIPGVLKNALDYAYAAYNRKPATFVGYGGTGATRAVEHLRLILAGLQVATLKHAVHIGGTEFMGMLMRGKTFDDYPYLEKSVTPMLDELVWWATTLKSGRVALAEAA